MLQLFTFQLDKKLKRWIFVKNEILHEIDWRQEQRDEQRTNKRSRNDPRKVQVIVLKKKAFLKKKTLFGIILNLYKTDSRYIEPVVV